MSFLHSRALTFFFFFLWRYIWHECLNRRHSWSRSFFLTAVFWKQNDLQLWACFKTTCWNNKFPQHNNIKAIDHFTIVCLVAWPFNESKVGCDLALIETLLLFLCKFLLITMTTALLVYEKHRGFYQSKVTSSLTFIERPGNYRIYSNKRCPRISAASGTKKLISTALE